MSDVLGKGVVRAKNGQRVRVSVAQCAHGPRAPHAVVELQGERVQGETAELTN